MNKNILLFIVFAQTVNSLEAQILPLKIVTQEQSEWCWVASSKCILDYYNYTLPQCEIAEYTRTVATWHSFGTENCCTNPSGANYWNYNWGYAGSIQDILVHFGNIQNEGNVALNLTEIQTEINSRRPFVIRWGWTTGGGHFLIGHGLQNETLYYMNPWYGEGLKFATYDWVMSNADHTWTHTNVLSTDPTTLVVSTNTLTLAAQANSTKVFDITSNIAWTAASNQTWLSVSSASGSGNAKITLTATANPTPATRIATIKVSGTGVSDQIITVTQDAGTTTGVNEISKNPVSMFPNPVANELTITELSLNSIILIFDINGKLLITKIAKSTTEKIDVSSLANGFYTINVTDKKIIKTNKLIKQ